MRVSILTLLALASSIYAQSPNTPATGSFPALKIEVTVAARQRSESGSFYRKTMTVEPKFTMESTSRLAEIPAAEAVMMIITMDTRAKYKENREAYLVHGVETIPVPAVKTGERRQFSFAEYSLTYDGYRDNSNVGGEIYKYYIFALRDPRTKTLIDLKTNNPPLAAFCKANPDKRESFLAMPKGKPFPATFK